MAIVFEYYEPQGKYRLAVWKSEESDGESDLRLLSPREAAEYATFKSPSRKREFLAVRRLVRQLAGDSAIIRYDSDGAPQLEDGRSLSITHSGDCVGVMTGETGRMGIDLETIRENIDRIVQKFMDDAEQASFGSLLTPEAMHVIWCAKEILFKIYRKGGIDFRKDLEVKPTTIRETGVVEAMIRKPDLTTGIPINYSLLDGFVLAWGHLSD